MGRKSVEKVIEEITKHFITTKQHNGANTIEGLAKALYIHNHNHEISTYKKYIRIFIKKGFLIETLEKAENGKEKKVYAWKESFRKEYISSNPMMHVLPNVSAEIYTYVETSAIKINHHVSSPIADIINTLYNKQNIYASPLGNFIVCYRFSNTSPEKHEITFTEQLDNILHSLNFGMVDVGYEAPPSYYHVDEDIDYEYNNHEWSAKYGGKLNTPRIIKTRKTTADDSDK